MKASRRLRPLREAFREAGAVFENTGTYRRGFRLGAVVGNYWCEPEIRTGDWRIIVDLEPYSHYPERFETRDTADFRGFVEELLQRCAELTLLEASGR